MHLLLYVVLPAISIAAAILFTEGCGASAVQKQAKIADAFAITVNGATTFVVGEYRNAQVRAVEEACPDRDSTCADMAEAAATHTRVKWSPVWLAHDALRTSHDLWKASLLKASKEGGSAWDSWFRIGREAVDAYVALSRIVRKLGVNIPMLPGEVLTLGAETP